MNNETSVGSVFALTTDSFRANVEEDPTPILIDVWAPWCGPCKTMKPILSDVAKTLGEDVRVATVYVDEEPALAEMAGIRSIPTLVVIKNLKVIDAVSGVIPATQLVQRVRNALLAS